MVSAIVLLIQPSALAAGLLLVIMGLVSWAAAVPLINLMPHINARGIRPAPQMHVNPYRYLARLKEGRCASRRNAAASAAAAAAAETAAVAAATAIAAAGHAGVREEEQYAGR
jgi:hypothetical protein